jgi:hypothetical protein
VAAYDTKVNKMAFFDPSRAKAFYTFLCRSGGIHPEAPEVFLHGVLEAGKTAEELLLSKCVRKDPSSVTPSKSSKVATIGEPSAGVKSSAPKFKERPNPIKSKKRLKSDYEKARERQKFLINRKKQKRDDEALKKKVVTN